MTDLDALSDEELNELRTKADAIAKRRADAMIDFDALSDDELNKLRAKADAAAKRRADKARKTVIEKITELAQRHAIDLPALAKRVSAEPNRKSGPARYRDPENDFNTWTGKGRRPKWLTDHLGDGKTLEQLAIPYSATAPGTATASVTTS